MNALDILIILKIVIGFISIIAIFSAIRIINKLVNFVINPISITFKVESKDKNGD